MGLLFFLVGYFFLTFFLLSLTFERQEKAGKDRKRSKKERAREKQESRLQPARGVRVRGPAPLTRALPYHTRP